jgi:hypothetical protein
MRAMPSTAVTATYSPCSGAACTIWRSWADTSLRPTPAWCRPARASEDQGQSVAGAQRGRAGAAQVDALEHRLELLDGELDMGHARQTAGRVVPGHGIDHHPGAIAAVPHRAGLQHAVGAAPVQAVHIGQQRGRPSTAGQTPTG